MSRSYRKTPILGITGNNSAQKQFRKQEHGRERALIRAKINADQFEQLPHEKQFGNEWDSPRDGKQWLTGPDKNIWMRK